MRTTTKLATILLASATLTAASTAEARGGFVHVRGANGGATAVARQNGGVAARANGTVQNADGSVTRASGGAYRRANGGSGYRASTTMVNPDGSASRQSQLSASGANGSVASNGGFARSADGTLSGSRSTNATNANTGNSYAGSTTIDPVTGQPVHTGTCTNAAGETFACR